MPFHRNILIFWTVLTLLCCVEAKSTKDAKKDENLPKDYIEDCHKDKELPWDAKDNYVDCKKMPKMVKEEKLDCCVTDGEVNCCDPDDKFPGDANFIWAGMGVITAILMIGCFLYNWFDKDTFPCLAAYQDRIDDTKERFMYYAKCGCLRKKPDEDDLEMSPPRKNSAGLEEIGHIPEDDTAQYTYSNAVF